jgi:hypothetical protein
MIKGKWIIESVEGFQKADEDCPVCQKSLRYLNIVITPENPQDIDFEDILMDLIRNKNENFNNETDEGIILRLECLWCPKCKTLRFRD